jgi:hypothetical protein
MRARRESRLRSFAAKLRGCVRGHRDETSSIRRSGSTCGCSRRDSWRRECPGTRPHGPRAGSSATPPCCKDRRALQTLPSIEAWWHDLRYALRLLWKDRGFAVVSIATLGLGIGAATAIFSVIYNVLLAPFPEKGAERMLFARIQNVQQGQQGGTAGIHRDGISGICREQSFV